MIKVLPKTQKKSKRKIKYKKLIAMKKRNNTCLKPKK